MSLKNQLCDYNVFHIGLAAEYRAAWCKLP